MAVRLDKNRIILYNVLSIVQVVMVNFVFSVKITIQFLLTKVHAYKSAVLTNIQTLA